MVDSFKHSRLFRVLDWLFGVLLMAVVLVALVLVLSEMGYASQPSIFVDNVNGAPTPNASGSPEAMTPVTAAATCHTNGAASTTIQWPANGITLPGGNACNTSGSENCGILFLGTAAGRQFTEILAVTADTVVVEDSFNIAAVSAVNCAVGGRLLNVEVQLASDMKGDHNSGTHGQSAGGWQIMVVNQGPNYVWTATRAQAASTSGSGFYGVALGGTRPVIECNFTGATCLRLGGADIVGLEFQNSNANKTGTIGLTLDLTGQQIIRDTIIGGPTTATAFELGVSWTNNDRIFLGSMIRNNTTGITATAVSTAIYSVLGTVFQGNGVGFNGPATGSQTVSIRLLGNLFWQNTTAGVSLAYDEFTGYRALLFNTFDDNVIGVSITNEASINNLFFASNLLTSNGTGVSYTGAAVDIERESAMVDYNCYGLGGAANGSNVSGFVLGPNVININPLYVDAATGDFTPRVTNFTIQSWPPGLSEFFPGTATESQVACGAVQPGGGVGGFNNVGI